MTETMGQRGGRSLIRLLSRHPVAMDAARMATAAVGSQAEVVIFDGRRASVVATLGDRILQPRAPLPAEEDVLAGAPSAVVDGATSVAIRSEETVVGAITVPTTVSGGDLATLSTLGRILQHFLGEQPPKVASADQSMAILQGLRDLVLVVDPQFEVTWCSSAIQGLLGWTPEDLIGHSAADFIHPDDLVQALDAATRLHAGHEIYRTNVRLRHARGHWLRVVITGMDRTDDPLVGGLVLSLRDGNPDVEIAETLDRNRRISATILQQLRDAVIAADQTGAITLVNAAARRLFGIDHDRPAASITVGDLPFVEVDGDPIPPAEHPLNTAISTPNRPEELCVETPDGLRYVTAHTQRVAGVDASIGVVVTLHDTTAAREAEEELRKRALHDQLTDLPNRRKLHEHLSEVAAKGGPGRVAACFMDLDGFKAVNDIHGHRTGDEVLREAGERLRSQLREDDFLARQGGDEFVAILHDFGAADAALRAAERLRAVLCEPYNIDGSTFHLTVSIGVALQDVDGLNDDLLLQQADIALYAAKSKGRNCVELFDFDLASTAETEQQHRDTIRAAIEDNGLIMHFQPIIDSDTGSAIGLEALARCRKADGALLGPSAFLDAIAGSSLIIELDRRALELSCKAAARIARLRPDAPLWVACNLSGPTLMQTDLVRRIVKTARRHKVDPSQLSIEVTESAAFEAGKASIRALTDLHGAGFRISLDDFGTGYSSLAHLRDLPLSTVKVDRSFIARLEAGTSERAISAAVVRLANDLGFGVVAEGVETPEQLRVARQLGFRNIQGWHYSPALSLDDVIATVLGRNADDRPAFEPAVGYTSGS